MNQVLNNPHPKDNKIILANSTVIKIGNHNSQPLEIFFKKLQNDIGCTYLFYIFEDIFHDKKIIYTSNWKWQKLLIGEKLINDCPVFKAGIAGLTQNKKSIVLPWNYIPSVNSKEKEITLLRSEFNIANGIGLSYVHGFCREGIGFGADIKDINFYQRILANNLFYTILKKMRLLAFNSIKQNISTQKILN